MIYAATITHAAGVVVEIFDELGIDPGRFVVTLHGNIAGDGGTSALVQDSAGTSHAFGLPDAEGAVVQFITDRDPVYVKNLSSTSSLEFYVLLTST